MADDVTKPDGPATACPRCGKSLEGDGVTCAACGFPGAAWRSFKILAVVISVALVGLFIVSGELSGSRNEPGHDDHGSSVWFSIEQDHYRGPVEGLPNGRKFHFRFGGEGLRFWAEVKEGNQTTITLPRMTPDNDFGTVVFWWRLDGAGGELQMEMKGRSENIALAPGALWSGWKRHSAQLHPVRDWHLAHGKNEGHDGNDDRHWGGPGHARRGEEIVLLRYEVNGKESRVEILLKAEAVNLKDGG
jgi:hypothetical protein